MYNIDLWWWGDAPPSWPHGDTVRLRGTLGDAAETMARSVAETDAPWVLLWEPGVELPTDDVLDALTSGRGDAWHNGLARGLGGLPAEHDYIQPTWPLAVDAPAEVEAVSWRADLGALLVRADVLRSLGVIDPGFRTRIGAGLELGRRLIERGAVIYHTPRLAVGPARPAVALDEHDAFLLLRRWFAPKWVTYAALRQGLGSGRVLGTYRGFRASAATAAKGPAPAATKALVQRPEAALPANPSVSVVLPTLGRYELVAEVLEQLCVQSVPPVQVVVVDQNEAAARRPEVYAAFEGRLPLEAVFQDERGQWISRNEAVRRTTGDWIVFIDDDSAIGPDFIERHLEGLARYDADLTTGSSLAVRGAPIPDNYAFFRVADQWDSGNGLCRRELFERFGLFDEQFDRQRRGDAEFGLRVQLGGGLVVHVPEAIRTHLKAEQGGLRTYGSWDGFRHRDRSGPLPLPSMLYYTLRYATPRQAREDLLIGVAQAIVPYELKRRATPSQWVRLGASELRYLPSTIRRVRLSRRLAREMAAEGPRVPELAPR